MNSKSNHSILPAAAIDVGFFSCKWSYGESLTPSGTQILVDHFHSVAPTVSNGNTGTIPGEKKTDGVVVVVDGVSHYVGKAATDMVGGRGFVREATPGYSETREYKAMFLGALFYIAKKKEASASLTIDYLTLGLPLSTVRSHSRKLIAMASGEHEIPSPFATGTTIKVLIKKVTVVSQPQGTLMYMNKRLGESISKSRVLVLDMGGGTFDWFTSNALRPQMARCGATGMGTLACAAAICDFISPNLKKNPDAMSDVDLALRENADSVFVAGKEYPMKDLWPHAESVLINALHQMETSVGGFEGMRHILITGGGADLLNRAIPHSVLQPFANLIEIDKDPVYSNVRGFHIISEIHRAAGL